MKEDIITYSAATVGVIILLVIIFFTLCFRSVGAGQIGVITRFGNVNRTATSGAVIKWPWPIERLYKLETRVQKEQQESAAATSDLQDVKTTLALNYALDGDVAIKVFKEVGIEYKDRIIIPALQESFKSASASYTAGELVTKRKVVKDQAYEVVKSRLEKYGIKVIDLNIVNFNFSDEFTKSIEAKQVAAQQAEQAKFSLERAKLDAQSQEVQKVSLSAELLQKYAIDKWDGKMPNYMGGGSVFNIPLVK